jgi:hypothetical protein
MCDVTARFEEMRLLRQKITHASQAGARLHKLAQRPRVSLLHPRTLIGVYRGGAAFLSKVEALALFPLRNVLTRAGSTDRMGRA